MTNQQGVEGGQVGLIADQGYQAAVLRLIEGSRERCLCSLFIVDIAGAADRTLVVDRVLLRLQAAVWRGVDVRLLIGGSRDNFEIARAVLTAKFRLDRLGVPSRLMAQRAVRGTHVKLVVADERMLVGSHNWSQGAFTNQTQDSVLVESSALAARLSAFFEEQWTRAVDAERV